MIDKQIYLESEIIRQAQNGNQTAYGELYQRHLKAIYHYILKRVEGHADAEDLTQTVFLKAWQALRDYQPTTIPFRSWLYRIAHNAVIDHHRGQRPTLLWDELDPLADPQSAPDALVLANERQETMQRAIATLRPAYQEIIVHRFLHDKEYPEMAAELGHQVNNLRVLQHRALEALRRVLTQDATIGLIVALTLLLLGRQVVTEAAQALPGDTLYPLRTVVEESTLLVADDVTDIRLHTDYAARRLAELQQLLQQGRTAAVATTANNLALHIRAASAQLARVTQNKGYASQAVSAQFRQDLQQQSATLAALAATAPQAIQPTLQPVLAVLREATKLADPAPMSTPQPTSPNQVPKVTTPLPTATPIGRTEPPVPGSGDAQPTPAVPIPTDPSPTEQPAAESIRDRNHHQPPLEPQRSLVAAPLTAIEPSVATSASISQAATSTPEPGQPSPTEQPPIDHPHNPDQANGAGADRSTDEQRIDAHPTAEQPPRATPSPPDATVTQEPAATPDPARSSAEEHKAPLSSERRERSASADTQPADPPHPDRTTNVAPDSPKPHRP